MNITHLITGGGPPFRRNAHAPIGGLPRGQSSDVNVTWIPDDPTLSVLHRPTHPEIVYPFPTPARQTSSRRYHATGPQLAQGLHERSKSELKIAGSE